MAENGGSALPDTGRSLPPIGSQLKILTGGSGPLA